MTAKNRKKTGRNRMTENRLDKINGSSKGSVAAGKPPIKVALTEPQSLAVHLMQERELRQGTVLEMNELLKELDKAQAENATLRRSLYQERLNTISKENADLRKQYELPDGNAKYAIEDGVMFLVQDTLEEAG